MWPCGNIQFVEMVRILSSGTIPHSAFSECLGGHRRRRTGVCSHSDEQPSDVNVMVLDRDHRAILFRSTEMGQSANTAYPILLSQR